MTPVSTARLAAQYLLFLIGGILAVLALVWAIQTGMQFEFRNPAMGIIVVYAAAAGTGAFWWKREPQPASGRRWRVALVCAALTIALQGAIMGLVIWAGVSLGEFGFAAGDAKILVGILAGLLVLDWLVIRVALGLAIRQNAKQARLRAEKAARA